MKLRTLVSLFLVSAVTTSTPAAPKVGDSYEQVIAEMGQPVGRSGAGNVVILTYDDVVVTLKSGKVTAVGTTSGITTVPDRQVTEADKRRVAAEEASAAQAPAAHAGWSTDYEGSLEAARGSDRKVFLFFTGSDWCGWCVKLNREVLDTPEFASYAEAKLVLVELDFPRKKAQAESLRKRNAELARKYGIRGFPTVVVLGPDGRVIGEIGYQAGGPQPFIAAIEKM